MIITFDIETIPTQCSDVVARLAKTVKAPSNYKDEEKIQAYIAEKQKTVADNTCLNGAYGEILSIACAIDDLEPQVFCIDDLTFPDREKTILTLFFLYIEEHYRVNRDLPPTWVGHNIVNFDIRFIYQRCIINQVKPFAHFPINKKPWDKAIFDTMTQWAGEKNAIRLDDLCFALSIPTPKTDLDGSKVWEYVQAGKINEVSEYNRQDVIATRAVYRKMTFREGK